MVSTAPVPEYQPVPAPAVAVAGGGGGGGYAPGGSAPTYQLPPMSNVRTKNDLINIDQFLEQMQNTIYESDDHIAASGVAQPGAHYLPVNYRTTNSPPTQLPPTHAIATTSAAASAPVIPRAASIHSPTTSATPALTPPSSAQSHTSGLSPRSSLHPGHRLSPPQHDAMYPRLPPATVAESTAAGYPTVSGATTSTLSSSAFDDERRRYTGGTLQRVRPETQQDKDEAETPSGKEQQSPNVSASLIDPALHSNTTPDREATQRTAQVASEVADRADVQWVEKVRLIEYMRNYIGSRLERGEFDDDQEQDSSSSSQSNKEGSATPEAGHDRMEGIEVGDADKTNGEEVSAKTDSNNEMEANGGSLYPVLRVMDEDGDYKVEDA